MTLPDHYSTLGVLPATEAVVIVAAYRALARRYHPDMSPGNPADAHQRMAAINEAYRVLGDAGLRAEYDAARGVDNHADYRSAENEESKAAFGAALHELENRWAVAVDIFPDLAEIRDSLNKTSASLAFEFVTTLLESKRFFHRAEISADFERRFLVRYFGTNEQIVSYAKELIHAGHRDAARTLNHLVDVMGSEVDPTLLLQRIEQQYSIRKANAGKELLESLAATVRSTGHYEQARHLAELLGYTIYEQSTGFWGTNLKITVTSAECVVTRFTSVNSFIEWVKKTLCALRSAA